MLCVTGRINNYDLTYEHSARQDHDHIIIIYSIPHESAEWITVPFACRFEYRAAIPLFFTIHSSPFFFSAGSSYATEAANSGVNCDRWENHAASSRREMPAGVPRLRPVSHVSPQFLSCASAPRGGGDNPRERGVVAPLRSPPLLGFRPRNPRFPHSLPSGARHCRRFFFRAKPSTLACVPASYTSVCSRCAPLSLFTIHSSLFTIHSISWEQSRHRSRE